MVALIGANPAHKNTLLRAPGMRSHLIAPDEIGRRERFTTGIRPTRLREATPRQALNSIIERPIQKRRFLVFGQAIQRCCF